MTDKIYLGILIAIIIIVFLGDMKLVNSMGDKFKNLTKKNETKDKGKS